MSTARLTTGRGADTGAYLRLVRPSAVLGAAGTTLVGAAVAGRVDGGTLLAMVTVACAVAAANAFNDLADVRADALNQPRRPLPAGEITTRGARRIVAAASALALTSAFALGPIFAAWVMVSLVVGLGYSTHLQRLLIVGDVTMAALIANALLFGAATAGEIGTTAVVGAIEVALFVLGREVLKGVPDIEGDDLVGVVTVATRWGWRTAVNVYLLCAGALLAAATSPYLLVDAPAVHTAAMAFAVVLPLVMLALALLRSGPERSVARRLLDVSKLTWVSGLMSVALLAL